MSERYPTVKNPSKVVQDDYVQGLIGADAVAKLLPQGGQGILMGGPPNASWARRRVAGFLDGIKKHPNIKVAAVVSSDNDASDGIHQILQCGASQSEV